MQLADHSIWIARPPEEVFDFFVDFSQGPRWRQYVREMTLDGPSPVRAGSRVHVVMDISGAPYTVNLEVLTCDRPSVWRHRTDEADFRGFIEYRFEAATGGTRVRMTMQARPAGLYGWLAAPLMLLRRNQVYAEQLPRLKAALEGSSAS